MRTRAPKLANARTVMLLAGAAFLVLPAAAFVGLMPADAWIRDALLDGTMPGLVRVMRLIGYAGSWWVILPGALLLLAFERVRRRWIWMGATLVASLLEPVLKEVVARPRLESSAFGFPSGHTTAAAAYFGALV